MNIKLVFATYFVLIPLSCTLFSSKGFAQIHKIATGRYHSLVICANGEVWGSGDNNTGYLANGTTAEQDLPVQAIGATSMIDVEGGTYHTLFLKSDGTVWASGNNTSGQLGIGTTTNTSNLTQVSGLNSVIKVSAGSFHSLFLKNDGTVWGCGNSVYGTLGIAGLTGLKSTPIQIPGLSDIIDIEAGHSTSYFLKSDGTVWCCGLNNNGQLGIGSTIDQPVPVQITTLAAVKKISVGGSDALFLKQDGTVWGCGWNQLGILGIGNSTSKNIPTLAPSLSGITDISAGLGYSLVLKNDGTVWASGFNTQGQFGDGTTNYSFVHKQCAIADISQISAGDYFSLFLKKDGTSWACGSFNHGALGNTYNSDQLLPVPYIVNCAPDCSNEGTASISACASYTWDATGITYETSGTYIKVLTNIAGCDSTATLNLTIQQIEIPIFTPIENQCINNLPPVLPIASLNTPSITGSWLPPTINTSTVGSTSYTFTPDDKICASTFSMDVIVIPKISPVFELVDSFCENDEKLVLPTNSANSPPISGTWSSTEINTTIVGTTSYIFTPNAGTCANTSSTEITVFQKPNADFTLTPEKLNELQMEATVTNKSSNAEYYKWDFGDGTVSELEQTSHLFTKNDTKNYSITLIAYSAEGCVDTTIRTIAFDEKMLYYLPNTFTPNDDHLNDIFTPIFYSAISSLNYSFAIYNRYGEIIFHTNDNEIGWNGRIISGELAQDGVYTWEIKFAKTKDDERFSLTGHFVLLR